MTSSTNHQQPSCSGSMPTTAAAKALSTTTNLVNNNHVAAQSTINSSAKRPLESTEIDRRESLGGGSDSSGERKFDAILDKVIDAHKIDFKRVGRWLREYLADKQTKHEYIYLITDLITDYLVKEKFPDAKVIQCEIADIGLLSSDRSRRLMRRLWKHMYDLQHETETLNASKYRKASLSSGSTTKISTSSRSDKYHWHKPHTTPVAHNSYGYHGQHANNPL